MLIDTQWMEAKAVTQKEVRQQYFYSINVQTRVHADVENNQNTTPSPTTFSEKREQKVFYRMIVNKINAHVMKNQVAAHVTKNQVAAHVSWTKTKDKQMTAGKASRSTSHHEKKYKHYLSLRKKEKYMCVIWDTCNNNTRIRGAILTLVNSSHTAAGGLKIIFKLHAAVLNQSMQETSR